MVREYLAGSRPSSWIDDGEAALRARVERLRVLATDLRDTLRAYMEDDTEAKQRALLRLGKAIAALLPGDLPFWDEVQKEAADGAQGYPSRCARCGADLRNEPYGGIHQCLEPQTGTAEVPDGTLR